MRGRETRIYRVQAAYVIPNYCTIYISRYYTRTLLFLPADLFWSFFLYNCSSLYLPIRVHSYVELSCPALRTFPRKISSHLGDILSVLCSFLCFLISNNYFLSLLSLNDFHIPWYSLIHSLLSLREFSSNILIRFCRWWIIFELILQINLVNVVNIVF